MILLAGCGIPTQVPTISLPPTSTKMPTRAKTVKPSPTPKPITLNGCVNASSLRVRSGPGTDSKILNSLARGTCILIVGRNADMDWVFVTYKVEGLSVDSLPGWVSAEYLDIDGNVNQLPIVGEENLSSVQQPTSQQFDARIYFLDDLLQSVINDPQYNQNTSVLHKYINSISIDFNNDTLTFIILDDIANADDYVSISYDLILMGALASNPGKANDWGLQRIEVINPGPNENYVRTYVYGADNILGIAEKRINVFEVSEVDMGYGSVQTPTPVVRKTNISLPEYIFCANTRNQIGNYVTCNIPFAYCEYQPSTNGSPTFCNDAPYPRNNFTLIFWNTDRSELGGKCIIVSGYVELYDHKPQIVASSRSQVSYCP